MAESYSIPLAERMRPKNLDEFMGQKHLVGADGILRKTLDTGFLPSIIFWGPPGVGKTTLAQLIAQQLQRPFYALSAINAGVKDIREVIDVARQQTLMNKKPVLFIDEIHRFNKSQQDSLLAAVEKGWVTLIGATTENPSFEVNQALLSRSQVYTLKGFEEEEMISLLHRAIQEDAVLRGKKIELKETQALLRWSGGDARKLMNALELAVNNAASDDVVVTDDLVLDAIQQNIAVYDKSGEQHYDIISAFIKSIRGSDPNAGVYWLARMLDGGEDPKFIARRLVILASEDIGNANPTALIMATNCFQAITMIGMPEGRIILSQCVTYLAASPKSNAAYMAINMASEVVSRTGNLPVPLHLRNAPTRLMKNMGYGKDYRYSHEFKGNFADQEFLPEQLSGTTLYDPGKNAREEELRKYLRNLWKDKYGY